MNLKIVGVGKCGSRVCYDFFAQNRGLPVSYELRILGVETAYERLKVWALDATGLENMIARTKMAWEKLTGSELLKDQAFYSIVDADLNNNEVAKQVRLLSQGGTVVFPGRSYALAGQTGGCQFHFISENLAIQWSAQDGASNVIAPDSAEVFAYAFSIGGGTGGGASPILGAKSRQVHARNRGEIHCMGIGILPKSDVMFIPGVIPESMDDIEKFNMGRFFVSWYGGRYKEREGRSFNGLWLVSNDLLRLIEANRNDPEYREPDVLKNKALSLINGYVAQALCTLCNASSQNTRSESDIDARELNINLNSYPYVSAFASLQPDGDSDSGRNAEHLQVLFRGALSNARLAGDSLQGLSVPIVDAKLAEVRRVLDTPARSMDALDRILATYDASVGPDEFKTARRIVMFYGQPSKQVSQERKRQAERIVKLFFPNSEWIYAHYQHPGHNEFLLLYIINPLLPATIDSMFAYIGRMWLKKGVSLSSMINQNVFDKDEVMNSMHSEDEALRLEEVLGESADRAVKVFEKPWPMKREHVVEALRGLHTIRHWKKAIEQTYAPPV